ncbi:acyltransferase family protein [Microbacterium sp. LMI1x-1-1.1]|uniref:acyltransferase family protein n=1 Tax=Microbacterium sp. LMI1x-1-1.1 TaxID=3135246 RepID=UPI003422C487
MVAGVQVISERKLSPRVRAGLDVARAAAAVYVVLHHAIHVGGPVGVLFSFGQEAVLVFFLLSGFVIFANERDRSVRPGGYFLRRLRRIYPPMVFAMLVSTALWAVGLITATPTLTSAIGTLFAVQDISFLKPGVITDPYLGNSPLWSLSYEIAFYAAFPLVMIMWRRSERAARIVVPAVAIVAYGSYLAAPNHFSLVAAYFLMWWAGAMLAHLWTNDRLRLSAAFPELAGLVGLNVIAAVGVLFYDYDGVGVFPVLPLRHSAFVLLLFILVFTPVRRWLGTMSVRVAGSAASVAGISYGLYVMHYPLLVQTGANSSWWSFSLAALLTVVLAWVADKLLPRLLPSAPRD